MPGVGCKVTPETLADTVSQYQGHTPHQVVPAAFSFAQASEAGTIYRPDEIAALAKIAHAHGMKVHMDGARFANALVRMNASPAEITWKAGVDVLSFGATKGGAMAAEAVVFFDRELAANMAERRKRAGHLLSKHRFLAVQFEAFLANDCWLRLARHANAMADRLAAGLAAAGRSPAWPVEANLVFVALPKAVEARLKAAGARYYVRHSESLPARLGAGPVPDPAGDLVCHPRGRDRPICDARRKDVKRLPQRRNLAAAAAPQSAAMLGDGRRWWREFREATNDLCRAGRAGPFCAGRGARLRHRAAACRRTKFSRSCARPASIRSASRCGAGRTTCCARSTNNDREVSVVVNARSGDVLSVTPVQTASRMPPPRGGVTMGPYERMPPGYVPPAAIAPERRLMTMTTSRTSSTIRTRRARRVRCPARRRCVRAMPRRCLRAVVRCSAATSASPLSEPNVITADPDRSGMLPPPPERFPQRAAPAAPPKAGETRRRGAAQAGAAAEA